MNNSGRGNEWATMDGRGSVSLGASFSSFYCWFCRQTTNLAVEGGSEALTLSHSHFLFLCVLMSVVFSVSLTLITFHFHFHLSLPLFSVFLRKHSGHILWKRLLYCSTAAAAADRAIPSCVFHSFTPLLTINRRQMDTAGLMLLLLWTVGI